MCFSESMGWLNNLFRRMLDRFFLILFFGCCGLAPLSADVTAELSVADQLARQHLQYIYGSEDISRGGLDCSGFVRTVFHQAYGVDLPDEAGKQLSYLQEHGIVWDASSNWTPDQLQPGDLIFWAGPIVLPRPSQICHVMIYAAPNLIVGAQGKGKQLTGTLGGVGYFPFRPQRPSGLLQNVGTPLPGKRILFAYGRLRPPDQIILPLQNEHLHLLPNPWPDVL